MAKSVNANEFIQTRSPDKTERINKMFEKLIKINEVNIKSQQRAEADLTDAEKLKILQDIFEENPRLFFIRFGKWVSFEDLTCFDPTVGSEMEYAITTLRKRFHATSSDVCVKNRRFEALKRLEKESDYFSEEEMQQRCPLLYKQYVGQYMTEEEQLKQDDIRMKDEVRMSSFIFQQIDRDWLKSKEEEEEEMEDCVEEEEEDESDDGIEYEGRLGNKVDTTEHGLPKSVSERDKLKLRDEFLQIMKQRFLEGLDEDFDYSKVDANEEYDNLIIFGQDEEEKYFDDEEPVTVITDVTIKDGIKEGWSADSDDDYLSDKILEKCCTAR